MSKADELVALMQENPDLPVIPLVYGEVVGDDYGYWEGSWESVRVEEVLKVPGSALPIWFKSDDDVFDVLEDVLTMEEFENLPDDLDGCRPYYDALPWKKAIVVTIGMPDYLE